MRINKSILSVGLLLSLTALNAEAALTPYTSAGQSLVYSSVSNITWTGDANLLGTMEASNPNLVSTIIDTIVSITDSPNGYDTPSNSGLHTLAGSDFGANGQVSWFGAKAFSSYLNTINYAGSNQWALPSAGSNPKAGYNQTGGQFGQLYYNELGGVAYGAIPNTATFINEQAFAYWLGPEYAAPLFAWGFDTAVGVQDYRIKGDQHLFYTWAVTPGQIPAVPVPGAIWLMGSGLLGLLSFSRRKQFGNKPPQKLNHSAK